MQNIVIKLNHTVELAQDSYYTRNPDDSAIDGAIGPECPSKVTFHNIRIRRHVCEFDGDVWIDMVASHTFDGWEIYSDTAVGPELTRVLKKVLPEFFETRDVIFSEQGMQSME